MFDIVAEDTTFSKGISTGVETLVYANNVETAQQSNEWCSKNKSKQNSLNATKPVLAEVYKKCIENLVKRWRARVGPAVSFKSDNKQ